MAIAEGMIESAKKLGDAVSRLTFELPITDVYNPLHYAWVAHEQYLWMYGDSCKEVVFLGMNPGPWGMAQTGVPFGEVGFVREWLGIEVPISKPLKEHGKRPIEGFDCKKSEVSGRRLWGLFKERFGEAKAFFRDHFVANYCPLVFMESSGKNRTPDKLSVKEAEELYRLCDEHLRDIVRYLKPRWVIGVGGFAEKRAMEALRGVDVEVVGIMHPSPANPAANSDWGGKVTRQLVELGVWE